MVSLLASSVVDRGFETLSRQTKDYFTGVEWRVSEHDKLWITDDVHRIVLYFIL
jgi:hypothetical protein